MAIFNSIGSCAFVAMIVVLALSASVQAQEREQSHQRMIQTLKDFEQADCNEDGGVDFSDRNPLITILIGRQASATISRNFRQIWLDTTLRRARGLGNRCFYIFNPFTFPDRQYPAVQ